jgi:hypothetical protein
VEFALSIGGAGWARGIGGTGIVTNEDVAFERGQAVILLKVPIGAAPVTMATDFDG